MPSVALPRYAIGGLVMAAAAVVCLAGVAWYAAEQTLRAAAFVSHTQAVLGTLGMAETALYRAEAAHRAFMISRRSEYQREREQHVRALRADLEDALEMTDDNPGQQRRVAALRDTLGERFDLYRETQRLIDSGQAVSIDERLEDGQRLVEGIEPMFAALRDEERRLLAVRETVERERSDRVRWIFGALVAAVVLLLPAVFGRLAIDLRARREAEHAVDEERRYDALHNRALTLYNAEPERRPVLEQTVQLLADTGRFPVVVFYEHDEWSGLLRAASTRGAPADVRSHVTRGDGALGEAVRSGRTVYLEGFDEAGGMLVETGLATLRPAALMMCPVTHQGKPLGVLAVAAAQRLGERDRAFVERLAAQLGVALHNADQLEGLSLLSEQLRERGEDIARKNELLERANRLKSEFLANMSHELRTPLNAVIGFSEILRDGLAGDLSAEQSEYVGDIYTSGRHLLSLINDILDLSKIEAGQMDLELDRVEPPELVASGLAVVRERAALQRIALRQEQPGDLGPVLLDARRAKQIVHNLLSNAVKFTPEGGTVTLAVRRVAASELAALRPGDTLRVFPPPDEGHAHYLEIAVTDTGIGIHVAALRELFQPFMQVDSSLSRKFEGTGLGLTMVQRLVELHGGGLMVRSVAGQGSTFAVWLPWRSPDERPAALPVPAERPAAPPVGAKVIPLSAPAPGAPVPALAAVPAAGGALAGRAPRGATAGTILVIEDDPRAASLLRLQLESAGFAVEVVPSGEAGLRRAAALQPRAVVLDVLLPDVDGWNTLARLKEQEATRHIPVVIVSITDEPRRGFALGAAQVLVKPVTQDDLMAALGAMGLLGSPGAPRRRVLVVDDDPKAVTLVCKHLEAFGFEPLAAFGGQEAIDLVRRERPDAVVLDLMMPHVSGFDVVEALASRAETAGIPVLVLTAKLVTAQDRELLRGRVRKIMEKSNFEPAALLAEVQRALAHPPREQRA